MITSQRIFLDKTIISAPRADPTKEYRNFSYLDDPGSLWFCRYGQLLRHKSSPVMFADIPVMFIVYSDTYFGRYPKYHTRLLT